MAEDWSIDVRKYVPDADAGAIAGIIRHCGIALQSRDASLVSFSDKTETTRVRENFLKKKLGLTESDADLDAAIADVGERMKADRTKNRVTVYYLLAERFGKLGLFTKPGTAEAVATPDSDTGKGAGIAALGAAGLAAGTSAVESAGSGLRDVGGTVAGGAAALGAGAAAAGTSAAETVGSGLRSVGGTIAGGAAALGAGAAAAGLSAEQGLKSAASGVAGAVHAPEAFVGETGSGSGGLLRWLLPLLIALALLGLLYWFLHRPAPLPAVDNTQIGLPAATAPAVTTEAPAAPDANAATATATPPVIPTGAGVTTETRDGKPLVKVYFDTGKAEVVPAFGPAAASLKTYLDANPGSKLTVAGFNDKTGNAAANAILSKNRAKAVQAALAAANIPADAIELTKPADSTDTSTSNAEARRVEVAIK